MSLDGSTTFGHRTFGHKTFGHKTFGHKTFGHKVVGATFGHSIIFPLYNQIPNQERKIRKVDSVKHSACCSVIHSMIVTFSSLFKSRHYTFNSYTDHTLINEINITLYNSF